MLNQRELDILNILWDARVPMTSTDIVNAGKGLSQSTVQTVLRKLLKGKLVRVSGITHSGNVLSRTYEPEEVSKDVIKQKFIEDYESFQNIVSKESLFSAMLKMGNDRDKNLEEIKNLKVILDDLEQNI